MAYRVLPFVVTVPANTLITAPQTMPLALDNWELESVDFEVPPGPAGLVGFQLLNNGVAWLPYGGVDWVVWDNRTQNFPLTDQPNGSGWAVKAYNAGAYQHQVTLRFHVNPVDNPATAAQPPTINIVTTPAPGAVPVVL